jgi:hypothetical protein
LEVRSEEAAVEGNEWPKAGYSSSVKITTPSIMATF